MHVEDTGDGPAVLLLHSTPGTTRSFAPLVAALAPTRRVLVPAMPGYGSSPRIVPYDLVRVRAAIEDELLARGVRSCSIVAHSGGTYHALMLSLAKRVHVEAMVLLGAVAGFDDAIREQYRQLSSAVRAGTDLRPMYRQTAVAPDFARRHPESLEEILTALDACPPDVLADEFSAFADAPSLLPRLADVRARTLLLVGDVDVITPRAWSEAIAARMPDARTETVAGCGHCLLVEDPTGTIAAVQSWLGATSSRASR